MMTAQRCVASLLIVSVTSLGMPLPAQAGTVSTEEAIAAKRDRIAAVLERSDVRAELEARGVSSSDAKARVDAMTDQEVTQLAARIDTLPAGGGDAIAAVAGGLVIMAGAAALLVALVLVGVVGLVKSLARNSSTPSQERREKPAGDASPLPSQG
jgi:hypothetical protein